MNGDYERIDQHLDDALLEDAETERVRDFLARWTLRDRSRPRQDTASKQGETMAIEDQDTAGTEENAR